MIQAIRISDGINTQIKYNGFTLDLPAAVDSIPLYLENALSRAGVRRERAYVNNGTLYVEGLLKNSREQEAIETSLKKTAEALGLKLSCELVTL